MKQLSRLIMTLLLACFLPAWSAPRPASQEHRKSYEDMTPAEIKAEVDSLGNKLIKEAQISPGADSMRTVIKNEAAQIEQKRQRFGKKAPDVVRLNPTPEPEKAQRKETDDSGMRVIELELPLYFGDRKNLTKKRVRIKAKPETIAIHRQILELDRMLIDDIVRMTGKPLQKNTGQKVRRR